MEVGGSIVAAALVGLLSYIVDRGISFHVCLYSAIASGGKFTGEQAYQEMNNPFLRPAKIVASILLVLFAYYFARAGGIQSWWEVATVFSLAIGFVIVSAIAALKAYRRTRFGGGGP